MQRVMIGHILKRNSLTIWEGDLMTNLIISIYIFFREILNKVKLKIIKKKFQNSCICGGNFNCNLTARIINRTQEKERIIIGDNCEINAKIEVDSDGKVVIGNYTTIRHNSYILSVDKIEIDNYVIISNNVTIYDNNNHPTNPIERLKMSKSGFDSIMWSVALSEHAPIRICDNVWIGEKATILKGVTIGKGSIVGTGSVVTKDVPPFSIVAGNPARVVKSLK